MRFYAINASKVHQNPMKICLNFLGFFQSKRIWGKYPAAMLVLELYPRALDGIQGTFDDCGIYQVDEKELAAFEQGFPLREKHTTASQERFKELAGKYL